ncbi:MAG: hypothetical protein JRN20_18880 [Nitrososphaerota archaeon]|nr:hypothetical protein [Nitrososphaerota archaeon]
MTLQVLMLLFPLDVEHMQGISQLSHDMTIYLASLQPLHCATPLQRVSCTASPEAVSVLSTCGETNPKPVGLEHPVTRSHKARQGKYDRLSRRDRIRLRFDIFQLEGNAHHPCLVLVSVLHDVQTILRARIHATVGVQ